MREFKSKPFSDGTITTLTERDLIYWYKSCHQKIELIKAYRHFTNQGLKDSKDAIEACYGIDPNTGHKSLPTIHGEQELLRIFEKHSTNCPPPKLTMEEILNLFKVALENGEKLHFTDELEIIETTCKNIRKNGGLEAISRKVEEFIDKI